MAEFSDYVEGRTDAAGTLDGSEILVASKNGSAVRFTTQDLVDEVAGGSGVQSVVAGTNVTVDATDPANPIVNASGGGGAVDSVNSQTGVVVLDAGDVGAVPTTLTTDTIIDGQGNELILQGGAGEEAKYAVDGPNNTQHGYIFKTGGVVRWQIHTDNNETGSANVGSDFHIERFDDAGAYLDNPIIIDRTDGVVDFAKPPQLTTAPAAAAKNTQVPTTAWVLSEMPYSVAASDEVTPITASDRITFPWPFPGTTTLVNVIGFLGTPQTSGSIFTVDIEKNGTTILSTLLTIDNTEYNSSTAATPVVISVSSIAFLDRITIVVTQIGDNTAKGLKIIFVR